MQRIVIVGAGSTIAQGCARLWAAERPCAFVLVGRDAASLAAIAADLQVRSPQSSISVATARFDDAADIARAVAEIAAGGPVDLALIAQGFMPPQAEAERDLALAAQTLAITGVSAVLFAEAFAQGMARTGRGVIVLIGSVAGDRGRKSNYIYGAAKGLVERYAQGLQHRFAGSEIRVHLIKPGPTLTAMTRRVSAAGLASASEVASGIVKGVASRRPVIYVPARWRWIMLAVRSLPRFVFHRTDF